MIIAQTQNEHLTINITPSAIIRDQKLNQVKCEYVNINNIQI